MQHKLRIVFPLCLICLACLLFSVIRITTSGESGAITAEVQEAENTWARMSGPTEARATTAAQDSYLSSKTKAPQTVDFKLYGETDYQLTDYERTRVEQIVMCEAGGESKQGQMMVAQCIKEGLNRFDYSIDEYIDEYKVFLTSASNVTDEVKDSVSRVFDDGERVTSESADLWYNPALVQSQWHEEQQYVTTIGSHRFFYMLEEE